MANKSYRLMYRFWLDITKPAEEVIADKIEVLKNERSFSSAIRDGIRLICDLRDGKLDVLFELFPWVQAEFLKYMGQVQPQAVLPEQGFAPNVEKYLQEILEKLDTPSSQPAGLQPIGGSSSGLKPIAALQAVTAPVFDDTEDDLELTVTKAKYEGSATQNLLKTLANIQNYKN